MQAVAGGWVSVTPLGLRQDLNFKVGWRGGGMCLHAGAERLQAAACGRMCVCAAACGRLRLHATGARSCMRPMRSRLPTMRAHTLARVLHPTVALGWRLQQRRQCTSGAPRARLRRNRSPGRGARGGGCRSGRRRRRGRRVAGYRMRRAHARRCKLKALLAPRDGEGGSPGGWQGATTRGAGGGRRARTRSARSSCRSSFDCAADRRAPPPTHPWLIRGPRHEAPRFSFPLAH